ncbi:MAG: CoA transferase [Dehalococcoidales bacterium]|nr:CoA transferase [Dehalococcoidales bacterium]
MKNSGLPLEGVRVVDFSWVWAGPSCAMFLASLGAEVIKIEGHRRTDPTRHGVVWPLPDEKPTVVKPNQGMSFNSVNLGKKSISLDLSKPEGLQLAKRIVAISDVVSDNLRAGAMKRMGLGYDVLRKLKPDLVAISLSSRGQEGPQKDYGGYATIHHAIGGGAYITGYPDDAPCASLGDIDIINGATGAFVVLSALYHKMQTGEGQYIDYSQCEAVSSMNGESFLGYEMTGEVPERMGNAHPSYAPHNLYKCWGVDRWLALEIHSDEEFKKLAEVIGMPELPKDARFARMSARKKNEAKLDKIIEEWTSQRDRDWMVREFCKAGLAAAPSRDDKDLYADPHLKARKAFATIDNPEIGKLELVGMPWHMSETKTELRCAPMLGQHNDYVLKELLGLSQPEVDELRRKDIIL